jgi:amino acid transporter
MFIVAMLFLLNNVFVQQSPLKTLPPRDSPVEKNNGKEKTDNSNQETCKQTPIILCAACFNEEKPKATAIGEETYNPQKDSLYRAYLLAAILGTLVAIVVLGLIFVQTKILGQQINIQQASAKQWVNLENWQIERVGQHPSDFLLHFEINNPTTIPLTLFTLSLKVKDVEIATTHSPLSLLVPKNPCPIEATFSLNETEAGTLLSGSNLFIEIKCFVSFTDAFENAWGQTFDRTLMHRPGATDIFKQRTSLERAKKLS